ncbi:MAG: acylphosphatase [Candidatus Nitrosocaldaceae archaeon]
MNLAVLGEIRIICYERKAFISCKDAYTLDNASTISYVKTLIMVLFINKMLHYQYRMKRVKVFIEGMVQGVGYRYNVKHIAMKHKVKGYVKNLDDGRVEVVAEGDDEPISKFLEEIRIRKGPIYVEDMDVIYEDARGEFKAFKIITGTIEDEMTEGFSTGALYFNVMLAKQDQMLAKQDQTLERLDGIIHKLDDVKTGVTNEIQMLRKDITNILNERFGKIEDDIAKIKARIGMI